MAGPAMLQCRPAQEFSFGPRALKDALVSTDPALQRLYASAFSPAERLFLAEAYNPQRTLFRTLRIRTAFDWLLSRPEAPEDFQTFHGSLPPRKQSPARKHIYLQPIGTRGWWGEGVVAPWGRQVGHELHGGHPGAIRTPQRDEDLNSAQGGVSVPAPQARPEMRGTALAGLGLGGTGRPRLGSGCPPSLRHCSKSPGLGAFTAVSPPWSPPAKGLPHPDVLSWPHLWMWHCPRHCAGCFTRTPSSAGRGGVLRLGSARFTGGETEAARGVLTCPSGRAGEWWGQDSSAGLFDPKALALNPKAVLGDASWARGGRGGLGGPVQSLSSRAHRLAQAGDMGPRGSKWTEG